VGSTVEAGAVVAEASSVGADPTVAVVCSSRVGSEAGVGVAVLDTLGADRPDVGTDSVAHFRCCGRLSQSEVGFAEASPDAAVSPSPASRANSTTGMAERLDIKRDKSSSQDRYPFLLTPHSLCIASRIGGARRQPSAESLQKIIPQ
jgi:hypothetical protein